VPLSKLSLVYHTVRHLRAGQIAAQVRHRTRRLTAKSVKNNPSLYPGCVWHPLGEFLPPGPQQNRAAGLLRGDFGFLNVRAAAQWPPDWHSAEMSKLWRYHLHYFDWLWALDYADGRRVVLDWINQCPPPALDAWDPYPLSLRVMNWCGYFWQRFRAETEADADFREQLWRSLCRQLECLSANLEYHLLANHLLENAAALALVGCCFGGAAAARWREKGRPLLRRQLREQILVDGMHFERSPMYHGRVTFLLLQLYASGDEALQKIVGPCLAPALGALRLMRHPDGQIALFNDSALAISNEPDQLLAWAHKLGVASPPPHEAAAWALTTAGYFGWQSSGGFSLICDAGPIGPDYNPGHAHGDIFSFELSSGAQRIIVDSGVFDYLPGKMRHYCRSTAAHNTVTIEEKDQCEFWGAFRVGRRGRPRDIKWEPSETGFRLSGWHDGYQRLRGSPTHARVFVWHRDGVLLVRDEVSSETVIEAVARVHLHPDCQIIKTTEQQVELGTSQGVFLLRFAGAGTLRMEATWFCSEFGKRSPNQTLVWRNQGRRIRFGFCVACARQIESFDLESGAQIAQHRYGW
jgi:uncharacterized heparinase superfamily protein